jgi:hypothetical protein
MTSTQQVLAPAFVHVGLVFVQLFRLGYGRVSAARRGAVAMQQVALDSSKWPERLRKLANSYNNQFELPVLFYALLGFLLISNLGDPVLVVLAWLFVASRLVHSLIHTTSNELRSRFLAFLAGIVCLLAMWLWFGLRLYLIG